MGSELYVLRDLVDQLIDGEIIRGRELGAPLGPARLEPAAGPSRAPRGAADVNRD